MVKNTPVNAWDEEDVGLIPGLERFPAVGNGNPLQYSCLENSIDRRAWWALVHEAAESQIQLRMHARARTHTHPYLLSAGYTYTHTHTYTHTLIYYTHTHPHTPLFIIHTPPHTLIYYMPGPILPGSTGLSLYLLSSLSEFNLNQVFSNRPLNYKLGHTVPYKLSEYFTFVALQIYLIICLMFITSNLHIYVFGNFWIKKRFF